MSQSRWLVCTLLFALCLVPIPVDAQPASFPTEWLLFDSDPNEGFAQDDTRDVTAAFFNVEDGFLFLRLQTVKPAGWPDTGSPGAGRYKFLLDTANADGAVQGGNINNAEFLLMVEDLTLNTADPTLTRDLLGELTFLDDLANVGFTARWNSNDPPKYTTNAVGSSFWRRELGSGTPGTGGPQGVFGTEIGYRIDGDLVDFYVGLGLLGNPTELRLLWATDQMNPNLEQAPNVDRPEEGFLLVPLVGTIEILKDAVPDSTQAFSFSGDLGSFTLTDDGVTPAIETFSEIEPGQYDVTETVPAGWNLGSLVCEDPDSGTTVDLASATATIDLDPGETVSCLFTDTETPPAAEGSITIVKNARPDSAQVFEFTGDLGAFDLADVGPLAKSTTFTGLAPGDYEITETPIPAGWDLADIVCVDPDAGTTVSMATATATIDLDGGESVTCTFVDEQRGSITIAKDALPDDPANFDFTGNGPSPIGAFTLDDDGVGTNAMTFGNLLPGSYEVTELVPADWLLVEIECLDPDGGTTSVLSTATATIDLDPGETVTCTFTDARPATLTILKDIEPDDPQDFDFTGDLGPFTLDDPATDDADGVSQSITFTDLAPFPLQITEEVTPGWRLATVVCNDPDGGSSFEPATRTLTADLDPGETVSCTFVNAEPGGTIVIAKDAVPDSAQVFDFTGSGPIGAFTLDDDGVGLSSATFTGLTAGTFTVTETVPAGWTLGSLVCEDPDGQTTVDLASATATIDLDSDETVTCTFTDTATPPPAEGSITIVKDAQPDSAQTFGFTGDLGAFSLTNQGTGAQSVTFPGLAPGSYQVTEQLPAEWNLSDIVCVDPDAGTTVSVATATATIDLDGGESVTCTFVNTSAGGTVTVVKDATPQGAQDFQFITDLGAFILVDDGTGTADRATFSGVATGSYDITEAVPDGWTLDSLVCDDPDSGTTVDLATATATVDLDPGETVTCTFFDTAAPSPDEGTVVIVKDAQPNSAQVFSFAGDLGAFNLTDDGVATASTTFTMVAPGDYAVSELVPAGWTVTGIDCVDPDDGTVVDVVSADALIDVDGGETITCTFVNRHAMTVLEVPTASVIALLLLAIGLGVVGLWTLRGGMVA